MCCRARTEMCVSSKREVIQFSAAPVAEPVIIMLLLMRKVLEQRQEQQKRDEFI